jgi:hypothetical protein
MFLDTKLYENMRLKDTGQRIQKKMKENIGRVSSRVTSGGGGYRDERATPRQQIARLPLLFA